MSLAEVERGGLEVDPCSSSLDDCPPVLTEDHRAARALLAGPAWQL